MRNSRIYYISLELRMMSTLAAASRIIPMFMSPTNVLNEIINTKPHSHIVKDTDMIIL